MWLKSGDATIYTSQAAADGFATIRYHRDDGDLRRLGPAPVGRRHRPGRGTEWTSPRPFDGIDEFGAFWRVPLVERGRAAQLHHPPTATRRTPARTSRSSRRSSRRRGSCPATRRSTAAAARRTTWRRSTTTVRPATTATTRRRTSCDFWGLHVWAGAAAPNPSWQEPVKPARHGSVRRRVRRPARRRRARARPHHPPGRREGPRPGHVPRTSGSTATRCGNCRVPTRRGRTCCRSAGRRAGSGNLAEQRAYWVAEDTILWAAADDGIGDVPPAPRARPAGWSSPTRASAATRSRCTRGPPTRRCWRSSPTWRRCRR